MNDLAVSLEAWRAAGTPVAIATVTRTWGSSPRPVGARMAITADTFVGSVSGGCVESAVIDAARSVLAGGPAQQLHFGVSNELAWSVGLACGGEIDVTVERWEPSEALDLSDSKETHDVTLVIVGAVHTADALVRLAKVVGYRTVVIDPRQEFARRERFAHADQLINDWPVAAIESLPITEHTAVALLSHDPKLDEPALDLALASEAFYVGALGSRKRQASRRERLRAAGFTEERVARLHGPIGLDLGALTPEEIAVSILAEIVAVWRGKRQGLGGWTAASLPFSAEP